MTGGFARALGAILARESYEAPKENSRPRFFAAFLGSLLLTFVTLPMFYEFILLPRSFSLSKWLNASPGNTELAWIIIGFFIFSTLVFSSAIGAIVSYSTKDGASLFCLFRRGIRVTLTVILLTGILNVLLKVTYGLKLPS
jgi:hypothetical protein